MISIAICEDEKIYRDKLKEFLEKFLEQKKYNVEEFENGESFLEKFEKDESYRENLDIVLLDIQMDGMNGMNVARKIRGKFGYSSFRYSNGWYEWNECS